MFNLKTTAHELEGMLKDIATSTGIFVPISKDLIKYKKYTVVKLPDAGWAVFLNDGRKKHIMNTFLKVSAFAVCKLHEKHQVSKLDEIGRNDQIFEKNYIDSLVFRHTYKTTNEVQTRDTALWRYEIAHGKAKHCKQVIDSIFYASVT